MHKQDLLLNFEIKHTRLKGVKEWYYSHIFWDEGLLDNTIRWRMFNFSLNLNISSNKELVEFNKMQNTKEKLEENGPRERKNIRTQ